MTTAPSFTRAYTTCVTGVHADMINVATPGMDYRTQPEWAQGATWIEIRIGGQTVAFPWTSGPPPQIGATVTIDIETP